jgi:hypothetical protein
MPLGVVVHPMADEAKGRSVPVVQLGSAGIVRCRRCRTYMSPFIEWTDAGRRWAARARACRVVRTGLAAGEEPWERPERRALCSRCASSVHALPRECGLQCSRCASPAHALLLYARRFKCNVCAMLNEIPLEYFSALDGSGRRRDADERPELSCGTVEYVAPTDYMVGQERT